MVANAAGHGRGPRLLPKIDRDRAGALERIAIELQPLGRAAARKPAARNDDVRLGTGPDQRLPVDRLRRARGEDLPAPAAALDDQKNKQFASAYAEISTIHQNARSQLQGATDPAKQQEVKTKAESDMIAAVERIGLNVNEFNQIATAMASDENVRSRVAAELQDRSSGGIP